MERFCEDWLRMSNFPREHPEMGDFCEENHLKSSFRVKHILGEDKTFTKIFTKACEIYQ